MAQAFRAAIQAWHELLLLPLLLLGLLWLCGSSAQAQRCILACTCSQGAALAPECSFLWAGWAAEGDSSGCSGALCSAGFVP